MHDISDESLAAHLSACTMSSAAESDDGAYQCRDGSFGCCSPAAADDHDVLDNQTLVDADADNMARNTSVIATSESSAADGVAGCSRRTDMNEAGSSLLCASDEGVKAVDAVSAVLCLLHGLSHCSYHEPSLLLLADHAAYHAAVDLFTCLWRRLKTSQQHNDKTQARVFAFDI